MTLENAELPQPALRSPRLLLCNHGAWHGVDFVTNIMGPGSLVRVIVGQQRHYASETNVLGGMT
jgi:hypothetical protein